MQPEISNEEAHAKILSICIEKTIQGLRVPQKFTNIYHKKIKAVQKMFDAINLQKILTDGQHKIILVSQDFSLESLGLTQAQKQQVSIIPQQISLNYNNLSTQQIFNTFQSPKKCPIPFPNSFQTAGHIAHYNLTQEQQKYRYVIGQITLLKCGNIRTVVNKTEKLHNVYRTPVLEHMAGQKNYLVKMREVGVSFQFDFQRVYWCSRLQKERDRVLEFIQLGECLADIFCGVGPLAVRAACKGAFVIANDLNPSCHEFLLKNCKINNVQQRVKCWNMCAKQAMYKIYKQHKDYQECFRAPDHIYMNLPVDAIEFLNCLDKYAQKMETTKMPLVHVNCFVVADSDEKSTDLLVERVNKVLPGFKKQDIVCLHHIKNVTVIMRMYCLSFRLRQQYGVEIQQEGKQEDKHEGKQGDADDGQEVDKIQKKIKEK